MPEQAQSSPEVAITAQARLHELAGLLRETRHLSPEARQELATLLAELGDALGSPTAATAETSHLVASAAHLAETLHHRRETGLLAAARDRLRDSALRVETKAPLATSIALRLIDALANLGI